MRDTERQREKQAACREPDVGLDPGSPESHPRPKAGAKPLSHPGIPTYWFLQSITGLGSVNKFTVEICIIREESRQTANSLHLCINAV